MKAISLRQPWADWVVQGKKTLELRTWTVIYRGPLAIHASQTINRDTCHAQGIDPGALTTGAIIGIVDLVDVVELDEEAFISHQNEHMASGFFEPPEQDEVLYGWRLDNARELSHPIPFRGRMGLFNVPETLMESDDRDQSKIGSDQRVLEWDTRQVFELRVIPRSAKTAKQAPYRLALYQRYVEPPPAQRQMNVHAPVKMWQVAELGDDILKAVADQVLDVLRENGYKATDLNAGRREPFYLAEESGVRLGLLFLAARPLTKLNRVEMISLGLRQMTGEELYYWFSKCFGPNGASAPSAIRAQKALRILLSGE